MASNSGETPSRPRQYRQYLRNATAPIPRTTLWRRSHTTGSTQLASLRARRCEVSTTPDNLSQQEPCPSSASPIFCHAGGSSTELLSASPPDDNEPSFYCSDDDSDCLSLSSQSSSAESSNGSGYLSQSLSSLQSLSPCIASPIQDSLSEDPTTISYSGPNDSLPDTWFTPLYPGAAITLCGALCAIMKFCSSNKLTYTAIGELLQLLHVICPPSRLPNSFYHFKKFFETFSQEHVLKKICLKCKQSNCSCTQMSPEDIAHLVNLDIGKPLETIISRNWEALHSPRFVNTERFEDIWDGEALKPMRGPGRYFSNCRNLALALSTDGVAMYKSSTVSIWPVYLVILNLPAHLRMNAENILLCGVWVGPTKPLMNLLLDPICSYLQRLSTQGMPMKTSTGEIIFRGKLVMGVFDLPAKAAILRTKQYNGEYGCSVCLHPGKRLPNNARIYLPNTTYEERTHDQFLEFAQKAEDTNTAVKGIVGLSPLSSTLDMVASIPIDYMHNVLEGVTKWLLYRWVDSKFHNQPYYIGRKIKHIDVELLKQRPPSEFSRPPRSIKKHLKYWKASEFRNWLLFYSLPLLLDNALPPLFWHHYALLVCAMHILLSDSITPVQVDAAEHMLKEFYKMLPELYGDASCTANAHLLSHLPKYVRLWGPLWTHSAFGVENKNGRIKHYYHGKSDIIHQLLFNIEVTHTLQFIHMQLQEHESEATLHYLNQVPPLQLSNCIGDRAYIVGKYQLVVPTLEQASALGYSGQLEAFRRLQKGGILYHSTSYERSSSSKRDNTFCCFRDCDGLLCFGRIELFVKTPSISVLVRQLNKLDASLISKAGPPCRPSLRMYARTDLLSSYIVPVDLSSSCPLLSIPIADIVSKVVIICAHNSHYCIIQPNSIERH